MSFFGTTTPFSSPPPAGGGSGGATMPPPGSIGGGGSNAAAAAAASTDPWSGLASQSLPNLGVGGGGAASNSSSGGIGGGGAPATTTAPPAAAAAGIGGGGGTSSSSSVAAAANTNGSSNATTTTTTTRSISLEERIRQMERLSLHRLLEEVSQATKRRTDIRIDAAVNDAWDIERDNWLHSIVAGRTLGGSAALLSSAGGRGGGRGRGGGDGYDGTSSSTSPYLPPRLLPASADAGGGTPSSSPYRPSSATSRNVVIVDPSIMMGHLNLVKNLIVDDPNPIDQLRRRARSAHQQDDNDDSLAATVVQPFVRLIKSLPTSGGGSGVAVDMGYESAWRLVGNLISGTGGKKNDAAASVIVDRAMASLAYLTRSFRTLMHERLRQSPQWDGGGGGNGGTRNNNATATACAAYVRLVAPPTKLSVGTGVTTTTNGGDNDENESNWATLYYCLRCGDAIAAYVVAAETMSSSDIVPDALKRLLRAWADAQRRSQSSSGIDAEQSLWECTSSTFLPTLDANDRQTLADLVVQATSTSGTSAIYTTSPYALGAYALASATTQPNCSNDVVGMDLMEDYLMFSLNKAIMAGQDHPTNANNNKSPVEALADLGNVLTKQFGPSYFDDNGESGGYSYALPLLLTQQYRQALSHLQKGHGSYGLLQATHLALVLTNIAGILISDLTPETAAAANQQSLLVPSSSSTTTASSSPSDSLNLEEAQAFTASLVSAYANQLISEPSMNPLAALEYLVRIPHKPRAAKEVAALIAKTQDTTNLVGTLTAEGTRQSNPNSPLDQFFTADQVSSILVDAAERLRRSGINRRQEEVAVLCYMLAGRYGKVLQMLSQLLSPPDRPDENRAYWLEQTASFHRNYIDNPTQVLQALNGSDNPQDQAAMGTSRSLVRLNDFFFKLRAGQTKEAWDIVEPLLPASRSELTTKEGEWKSLDPLVKAALPGVLVGAVHILHQEHRRLKQLGSSAAGVVERERLHELQDKARLLVTYSGLVGIDPEQKRQLSRMEELMI